MERSMEGIFTNLPLEEKIMILSWRLAIGERAG